MNLLDSYWWTNVLDLFGWTRWMLKVGAKQYPNAIVMNDRQKVANLIKGDGTWPFLVGLDDNDLVIANGRATCFGGTDDPEDSGETASGINTKHNADIEAVALPMRYDGSNAALKKALGGSPVPKVPWLTLVEVTDRATGLSGTFPVIDLGPAKRTGNAIDLTPAAARRFNPQATARNFEMRCDIRILRGVLLAH